VTIIEASSEHVSGMGGGESGVSASLKGRASANANLSPERGAKSRAVTLSSIVKVTRLFFDPERALFKFQILIYIRAICQG